MARILIQTNDRRTVLDEGDVRPADMRGEGRASALLDRLETAVHGAEPVRPRSRRLAAAAFCSDYREVCG